MPFHVARSLALALLIAALPTPSHAQDSAHVDSRIRPSRPWIADVIVSARQRSHTLDSLISRLDASQTIVQVVEESDLRTGWDGRISFLAHAGGYLYLRIGLRQQTPLMDAAVLAHELQHAAEIGDAHVTSLNGFTQLYRRIGVSPPGAPDEVDTPAAVLAGAATLRELTGRPVLLSLRSRQVLATTAPQ